MHRSPTPEWKASFQSGQARPASLSAQKAGSVRPSKDQTFSIVPEGTHPSQGQDLRSRMEIDDSVAQEGNQKAPYFKAVMGEAGFILDTLSTGSLTFF